MFYSVYFHEFVFPKVSPRNECKRDFGRISREEFGFNGFWVEGLGVEGDYDNISSNLRRVEETSSGDVTKSSTLSTKGARGMPRGLV